MSSCRFCLKTGILNHRSHLKEFHNMMVDSIDEILQTAATRVSSVRFERWKSGSCQYKCDKCLIDVFGDSRQFWDHVKSTHQMTPREYKSIHPGYLICKSSVTCELCEWSILHDEEKLRRHFELYHPLVTLGEYYSNYVASRHSQLVDGDSGNEPDNEDEDKNDAEIEMVVSAAPAPAQAKTNNEELNDSGASSFLSSPASRRSSSGSESSSSPEVATNNDLTKIQEFSTFSYLFESDLFNCEICRKEIVVAGSCEVADRHVRECHGGLNLLQYSQIFHSVPTAAAWYDASLFKCSICPDFIDTSNDRLRRHLSSCHEGMTVGRHTELTPGGDATYLTSRIECVICGKKVAHRRGSLYGHIKACMSSKTGKGGTEGGESNMAKIFRDYYPLLIKNLTQPSSRQAHVIAQQQEGSSRKRKLHDPVQDELCE